MQPRAFLPAAGLSLVWIILAALTPGTTFHLAPAIVAAAPSIRALSARPSHAMAGMLLAMAISVGLAFSGRLEGPTLLPAGGALAESILMAVAGGLAGWVLAGRLTRTVSGGRH